MGFLVFSVPNMPNIWHLAHLVYQTPKTPFIRCSKSYKICNMLQYPHKFATIQTYVAYAFIIIFLFIFLSHLSVNLTLKPQSSPLSPQSSPFKPQPSLLFHADANNHFHADLSLAMVFLFFFFGCGLMGVLGNGWV